MFEGKSQPPISQRAFALRLLNNFGVSTLLIVFSLILGIVGFHIWADLPWDDSLLNAAMLLSGMGPLDKPARLIGKLFASFYALYSGLVLILVTGVMLAPLVHRIMHRFHFEEDQEQQAKPRRPKRPR